MFLLCLLILAVIPALFSRPRLHFDPNPEIEYCSGRGIKEPDSETCECYQCFSGDKCETDERSTCTLDMTCANGFMFDEWFANHWKETQEWAVTIPPWYRPSYPDPIVYPSTDNALNRYIHGALTDLHAGVMNANTTGKTLVAGFGSTQVIRGLLYAISVKEGRQLWVYARAPHYPKFADWANENPDVSLGFTTRTDLNPKDVIEFVTYPNNPDGSHYPPVYPSAAYHIYDMVYLWPHTDPVMHKPGHPVYDHDVMVFSSSKMTGHSGSRVGWGWLKDPELGANFGVWAKSETNGMSVDPLYRQMSVIDHVLSSTFFEDNRVHLLQRWVELLPVLAEQKLVASDGLPNTWFLWLKCPPMPDCVAWFKNKTGLLGMDGGVSTGVLNHVRLNLNVRNTAWDLFLKRLQRLVE